MKNKKPITPTLKQVEMLEQAKALHQAGLLDMATANYKALLKAIPSNTTILTNLGTIAIQQGKLEEAVKILGRSLQIDPNQSRALNNMGLALQNLNRLNEALSSYDRAIAINPTYVEAHSNRGNVLKDLNHLEAAMASYDLAIAINPDYAVTYLNKSFLHILTGNYQEGWRLHEWRWGNKSVGTQRRSYRQPLWLGEQIVYDKTLLIYPEQGLGDYIQFVRYAALAEQFGAKVIIETPSALMTLAASLKGEFTLIEQGSDLPNFDYHCPIMSLPLAFKTTLETIPAQIPYLFASPEKSKAWAERLGDKLKPRVGLVWQGGFRPDQPELWAVNQRRNIKLTEFSVLKDLDLAFYSLQKGQAAESELHDLQANGWDGPNIHDLTSQILDFSDTAALIDNLDLIIAVDTSTAHLAAAMGKQVWILNRFDTCWRWLLNRNDSPWYPTVTLFRQTEAGNWSGVIERVKTRLIECYVTT